MSFPDMRESVLLVEVPEAEPLVGSWRLRFDPVARHGIPAHVTLLFPFRSAEELDLPSLDSVARALTVFPAFEVTFRAPASFPGVVWLRPEPADQFRAMTAALAAPFPDCPPYGGQYAEIVPHLTVGQGLNPDTVETVLVAMQRGLLERPVWCRVKEAHLYVRDGDQWYRRERFPLGPGTCPGSD